MQAMETMDEFITPGQAAKMLGVGTQSIYRWIKNGDLAHIKLPSGYYKIFKSEISRILTPVPADGVVGEPVMEKTSNPAVDSKTGMPPELF